MILTKQCKTCEIVRPLEDFPTYKQENGVINHRHSCRFCKQQRVRNRAVKNSPERLQQMRENAFLRKYGLTWVTYLQMFEDRKGLCDICGLPETRKIKNKLMPLCVDHDAITGLVRGLLCSKCNVGIGMLNHSLELLEKALVYLGKGEYHSKV